MTPWPPSPHQDSFRPHKTPIHGSCSVFGVDGSPGSGIMAEAAVHLASPTGPLGHGQTASLPCPQMAVSRLWQRSRALPPMRRRTRATAPRVLQQEPGRCRHRRLHSLGTRRPWPAGPYGEIGESAGPPSHAATPLHERWTSRLSARSDAAPGRLRHPEDAARKSLLDEKIPEPAGRLPDRRLLGAYRPPPKRRRRSPQLAFRPHRFGRRLGQVRSGPSDDPRHHHFHRRH